MVFKRTSVRLSKREKIYHRLARVSTDLVPLIIYQITTVTIQLFYIFFRYIEPLLIKRPFRLYTGDVVVIDK